MEKWHVRGMGAVVGAKEPEELELVMWDFYDSKKEIPLLVPGVGAQGTSASMVAKTLRTIWLDAFPIHRINSSSAIAYAYRKKGTADFVGAALGEIKKLNGRYRAGLTGALREFKNIGSAKGYNSSME